jgi:hypothetical protein
MGQESKNRRRESTAKPLAECDRGSITASRSLFLVVLRYKHVGEVELTILKNSYVSDKAYKLERRGETGPFCRGRNAFVRIWWKSRGQEHLGIGATTSDRFG